MPTIAQRVGMWLLLVPLIVNALTGPYLISSGENGDERIVGVLMTTFCLLGIAVAWEHRRAPSRALHRALWLAPIAFAGIAAVMLAGSVVGLGTYHAALAVIMAGGIAMWRVDDAPARASDGAAHALR